MLLCLQPDSNLHGRCVQLVKPRYQLSYPGETALIVEKKNGAYWTFYQVWPFLNSRIMTLFHQHWGYLSLHMDPSDKSSIQISNLLQLVTLYKFIRQWSLDSLDLIVIFFPKFGQKTGSWYLARGTITHYHYFQLFVRCFILGIWHDSLVFCL